MAATSVCPERQASCPSAGREEITGRRQLHVRAQQCPQPALCRTRNAAVTAPQQYTYVVSWQVLKTEREFFVCVAPAKVRHMRCSQRCPFASAE